MWYETDVVVNVLKYLTLMEVLPLSRTTRSWVEFVRIRKELYLGCDTDSVNFIEYAKTVPKNSLKCGLFAAIFNTFFHPCQIDDGNVVISNDFYQLIVSDKNIRGDSKLPTNHISRGPIIRTCMYPPKSDPRSVVDSVSFYNGKIDISFRETIKSISIIPTEMNPSPEIIKGIVRMLRKPGSLKTFVCPHDSDIGTSDDIIKWILLSFNHRIVLCGFFTRSSLFKDLNSEGDIKIASLIMIFDFAGRLFGYFMDEDVNLSEKYALGISSSYADDCPRGELVNEARMRVGLYHLDTHPGACDVCGERYPNGTPLSITHLSSNQLICYRCINDRVRDPKIDPDLIIDSISSKRGIYTSRCAVSCCKRVYLNRQDSIKLKVTTPNVKSMHMFSGTMIECLEYADEYTPYI
jgi:hypothetical protein